MKQRHRRTAAPPPAAATDPFVQVDLDAPLGCGLRRSGVVACFDDADPVLRPVPGLTSVVQIAVNSSGFFCAVLADGHVRCVDHDPHTEWPVRQTAPPIADATSIFFRDQSACVLRRDGTTSCFVPYDNSPPEPGPYGGAFVSSRSASTTSAPSSRTVGSTGGAPTIVGSSARLPSARRSPMTS